MLNSHTYLSEFAQGMQGLRKGVERSLRAMPARSFDKHAPGTASGSALDPPPRITTVYSDLCWKLITPVCMTPPRPCLKPGATPSICAALGDEVFLFRPPVMLGLDGDSIFPSQSAGPIVDGR